MKQPAATGEPADRRSDADQPAARPTRPGATTGSRAGRRPFLRLCRELLENRLALAGDGIDPDAAGAHEVTLLGGTEQVAQAVLESDPSGTSPAHRITFARNGFLDVSLAAEAGAPGHRQLLLRDAAGVLVATSATRGTDVKLSQYLPAGDYDLTLAAASGAVGTVTIVGTHAEPPGPLMLGRFAGDAEADDVAIVAFGRGGLGPVGIVVADTAPENPAVVVFVALPDAEGRPGGRFQRVFDHRIDGGRAFGALAIADLDGDDLPDIVVAGSDYVTGTTVVTVLTGHGDGRFTGGHPLAIDGIVGQMQVADIDRDGHRDAVLTMTDDDTGSASIVILWGTPEGLTATAALVTPVVGIPTTVVAGDLDGDGAPDIAAGFWEDDAASGRIDVWSGLADPRRRDRGLATPVSVAVTHLPHRLAVADLDHDGRGELVAVFQHLDPETGLPGGGSVAVLKGSGRGTFVLDSPVALPGDPTDVAVGDVDGDGRPDVVVALATDAVGILRGDGRGKIAWIGEWAAGSQPSALALGDVDADGRLDIITADNGSGTVTILRQRPDGSYPGRPWNRGDTAVVPVDVNGDGRIDVVTRVPTQNAITVLIGRGDGTFLTGGQFAVGSDLDVGPMPVHLAVADVNGDGRPDVVTANEASHSLTVLLGLGDGSFGTRLDLPLDAAPSAVVVQDVDGDGVSDIVVTTGVGTFGAVTVLYGTSGRLSFAARLTRPVGFWPVSVAVADIDGDGRNDLVVANRGAQAEDAPGSLSVMLATGPRRFAATRSVGDDDPETAGEIPIVFGAAVGDLDFDGRPDIALTVSRSTGNVLLILGHFGPGGFSSRREIPLDTFPTAPVLGDLDGDGRAEILVGLSPSEGVLGSIRVFRAGSAILPLTTTTLPMPTALAIADLDADGRGDVVAIDGASRLLAFMSQPDGSLGAVGPGTFADRRPNRVVPLPSSAGMPGGSITLDRTGAILVRRAGRDGVLDATGVTAFDIAVIGSTTAPATIAAIDADRGGFSLFTLAADGSLGPRRQLAVPGIGGREAILSRIRGGDVDGDGHDDIVVSDPGSGSIRVLLAGRDGDFSRSVWRAFDAGAGVSEFVLTDVDGDQWPDLVAAGQVSGYVSVRRGIPATADRSAGDLFGPERRFRATLGDAAFATDRFAGRGTPVARAPIDDVAVADVDGDGHADILVASSTDRSISILAGLSGGGFAAPREHHPRVIAGPGPVLVTRAVAPRSLATGDLDGDGRADVAVLDRENEQVLVYLSGGGLAMDGSGLPTTTIPLAGNAVTSLLVADHDGPGVRRDGVLDLVVGNDYGDVLLLRGEADARGMGTGRFARSVRADGGVALVATDVDGDGATDFIYGSRSLDSVTVNTAANEEVFRADQGQGVIGPSAVATVVERVGGRDVRNLLVLNGAGNELLVFHGTPQAGAPFLPPRRFFVGTNPTALEAADFNADGVIDVAVANSGSSDLSILLGATGPDGRWTLRAGPRVVLGGGRPASLAVGDFVTASGAVAADGIPDIAVTTVGRDEATIIPGVGGGFFADNALRRLALPNASNPAAIFAVPRGTGRPSSLVVVNPGTSSISTFDAGRGFARQDMSAGGLAPRAAAAYSQGGTTVLAVANAGTGNVAVFLASPGSLLPNGGDAFAAVAGSPNANASSLAFDSTGRLFGMSAGDEPPLALYSFRQPAATPAERAPDLRALINFLPSQVARVGLVATLVTSAGIPVAEAPVRADEATGGGTVAGDAILESGDGEPVEPVADEPPRDTGVVAEAELAPILRLFLDLEAALEDTNARLLETLLSRKGGRIDAAVLARAVIQPAEPAPPQPEARAATPPPQDFPPATTRAGDAPADGDRAARRRDGRAATNGSFAAFDSPLMPAHLSGARAVPRHQVTTQGPVWPWIVTVGTTAEERHLPRVLALPGGSREPAAANRAAAQPRWRSFVRHEQQPHPEPASPPPSTRSGGILVDAIEAVVAGVTPDP